MKPTFLLHTCCAICSGHVIQELSHDFDVVVYFYNPNIHPEEEYLKRKKTLEDYCSKNGVKFIEAEYDEQAWLEKVKGLENEPEGGKRCKVCYQIRLEQAAKKAEELKCDYFGSTLTISPHKKADIINPIGTQIGDQLGVKFYEADWKKKDGFKKANEISRTEGFYRQNYCGCVFSKNS